jgi:hypothetical protein
MFKQIKRKSCRYFILLQVSLNLGTFGFDKFAKTYV